MTLCSCYTAYAYNSLTHAPQIMSSSLIIIARRYFSHDRTQQAFAITPLLAEGFFWVLCSRQTRLSALYKFTVALIRFVRTSSGILYEFGNKNKFCRRNSCRRPIKKKRIINELGPYCADFSVNFQKESFRVLLTKVGHDRFHHNRRRAPTQKNGGTIYSLQPQ